MEEKKIIGKIKKYKEDIKEFKFLKDFYIFQEDCLKNSN